MNRVLKKFNVNKHIGLNERRFKDDRVACGNNRSARNGLLARVGKLSNLVITLACRDATVEEF